MSFDLPADMILPLDEVWLVLDPAPHPFEAQNARAVEETWQAEHAANPALFDGRMALLSRLALRDGRLDGTFHMVRYATFLLWRRRRPVREAGHLYLHPVLATSDDALVAIRMARHTVNPGQVYFPAGSFEEDDFAGGRADPAFNMRREVLEETGIDISGLRQEAGFHLLSKVSGTVLFRKVFLDRTADDVAAGIRAHVAGEADPEIDGPVVIRDGDVLPEPLADQMAAIIDWHFRGE